MVRTTLRVQSRRSAVLRTDQDQRLRDSRSDRSEASVIAVCTERPRLCCSDEACFLEEKSVFSSTCVDLL
jgi:hypothetical protein